MSAVRCDAPDFSRCPAPPERWRFVGDDDRCDSWGGFRAQAERDLGVDEWTPDVDPRAEVLFVRWRDGAPRCVRDAGTTCVVVVCALPSPAGATAAAAERGR